MAGLVGAAAQASEWANEPFLHAGEDPAEVLLPGSARRRALEAALAELPHGPPSPDWRIRYGLLLGLERVLAEDEPQTAAGTTLRRHQVDALAGLLGELIARAGNGDGDEPAEGDDELRDEGDEESETDEREDGAECSDECSDECLEEGDAQPDPGAERRFRFRHPTASGKTIAAAGFVEAARELGVLILTHRRLLVDQFSRDLTSEGYGARLTSAVLAGAKRRPEAPLTIQTYAWFIGHYQELDPDAYQLVICDEAHTALGEKTSAAIRAFHEPLYVGMTATEELLDKQVSDVFPASVDDLPLKEAARRGLVAPLRCLRVPPTTAVSEVPLVGGDFDQQLLAQALDHDILNQAAASLYRDRFHDTPGIVYAAGVAHAEHLAKEFRATGLKAQAVSGKTPPLRLAETLAAYERGDLNVLVNAQLLAEGWNSPRATVVMHLAPTASKRVYQQRIGRVMRVHSRKEAGIVVDFTAKGATHSDRVVSLHSLLDVDFYREGARVTPAPRTRSRRRARRRLEPANWLMPVSADPARRLRVINDDWKLVNLRSLSEDEQAFWGRVAGRQARQQELPELLARLAQGQSSTALREFLTTCAAENPDRALRVLALKERVALPVEGSDFDDLVQLISSSLPWEKERTRGAKTLLGALAQDAVVAHPQLKARWAWQLAELTKKRQDQQVNQALPEAKKLLGLLANSRGRLHEQHAAKLAKAARALPCALAAPLLAAAEAYTPQARNTLAAAREALGTPEEVAAALAGTLPDTAKKRKKRRKKRRKGQGSGSAKGPAVGTAATSGAAAV